MAKREEVWLRGRLPGISAELQPTAHAVLQAIEDLDRLVGDATADELWRAPGGAATLGYHLRHLAGATDRLLTYARGEGLSEAQLAAATLEREPLPDATPQQLLSLARAALEGALEQCRRTSPTSLGEARFVGRAKLPSTLRGLLYHVGEHASRHVGQIATTLKVLRGR